MYAVQLQGVSKTFGRHRAVDGLDLTVPVNCIHGFIGPNGSGKTTTLRMIMRIYHPDPGPHHIRVLGEENLKSASDRVGYLPEERGLYRKMLVGDVINFYASLRKPGNHQPEIGRWLERMGLGDWKKKKVETLSKGMSQKVQFISAIVGQPELVILDEPFSGLDPVNAEVLKDAILELRRQGSTVIFSTHDMDMAERMCDFIFMIFQGKKVLDGTLDDIQNQYGSDTIRLRMDGNGLSSVSLPGVERINDYGRFQELKLDARADSQDILRRLMDRGAVQHFEIAKPSLHDIFVRIAKPDAKEVTHA